MISKALQFAIGLLTGKAGGLVLGIALSAFSAIGLLAGWQAWTIKTLQTDVATANGALAQCKADKVVAQANAGRLADAIEAQNKEIAELQAKAAAESKDDELQAVRILNAGEDRQKEIMDSPDAGAEVMNQWFAERF